MPIRTLMTMTMDALTLLWVWGMILVVCILAGCTTVRYDGPGCTLALERFALPGIQGETSVTSTSCTLTVN